MILTATYHLADAPPSVFDLEVDPTFTHAAVSTRHAHLSGPIDDLDTIAATTNEWALHLASHHHLDAHLVGIHVAATLRLDQRIAGPSEVAQITGQPERTSRRHRERRLGDRRLAETAELAAARIYDRCLLEPAPLTLAPPRVGMTEP